MGWRGLMWVRLKPRSPWAGAMRRTLASRLAQPALILRRRRRSSASENQASRHLTQQPHLPQRACPRPLRAESSAARAPPRRLRAVPRLHPSAARPIRGRSLGGPRLVGVDHVVDRIVAVPEPVDKEPGARRKTIADTHSFTHRPASLAGRCAAPRSSSRRRCSGDVHHDSVAGAGTSVDGPSARHNPRFHSASYRNVGGTSEIRVAFGPVRQRAPAPTETPSASRALLVPQPFSQPSNGHRRGPRSRPAGGMPFRDAPQANGHTARSRPDARPPFPEMKRTPTGRPEQLRVVMTWFRAGADCSGGDPRARSTPRRPRGVDRLCPTADEQPHFGDQPSAIISPYIRSWRLRCRRAAAGTRIEASRPAVSRGDANRTAPGDGSRLAGHGLREGHRPLADDGPSKSSVATW